MDPADADNNELQRRVLQSTLDEVAARDNDAADCCVICLEAITEPCKALPCGHTNFDYLCVANWLFATPRCPLCKSPVDRVTHGPPDNPQTTSFEQPHPHPDKSTHQTQQVRRGGFQRGPRGRGFRRPCPSRPRRPDSGDDSFSGPVAVRRNIYMRQRFSKHVGSNRLSRYREMTPRVFCEDEELVSRARMFIRRELQVFSFLSLQDDASHHDTGPHSHPGGGSNGRNATERRRANNAEFLLEYVIAILKSVDIMGSGGQAEDMLADFLGRDNTRLFLHELRAWLRSPFTKLEDWDRAVQYDDDSGNRNVSRAPTSSGRSTRRSASPPVIRGRGRNARHDIRTRELPSNRPMGDFYRPSRHGKSTAS